MFEVSRVGGFPGARGGSTALHVRLGPEHAAVFRQRLQRLQRLLGHLGLPRDPAVRASLAKAVK